MKSPYRTLLGCALCIAAICLSASATITAKENTPQLSLNPANTVIAENQTVTGSYDVTVTVSLTGSATVTYTMYWNCYVDGSLYYSKTYSGSEGITLTGSWSVPGSFPIKEAQAGEYSVYCTAQGEVTAGSSTVGVTGTSNTATFTVDACTGEVSSMTPEENASEPPSYIQLDWTIDATMNPAYSGNQSQTTNWYQGIDGDLTGHSPPLDIDCEDGNNDDPPAQEPTIAVDHQEPGSGEVTFVFNVQQYDYSWDTCSQDVCPPPPPGSVENVQVVPLAPQKPQLAFQCGK